MRALESNLFEILSHAPIADIDPQELTCNEARLFGA